MESSLRCSSSEVYEADARMVDPEHGKGWFHFETFQPYNPDERKCRSDLISHAIKCLTTRRDESACVKRDHVGRAWQQLQESGNSQVYFDPPEIESIEHQIWQWQVNHEGQIHCKDPLNLKVCYLAGCDLYICDLIRDLNLLVEYGVFPRNICAVMKDSGQFQRALEIPGSSLNKVQFFCKDTLSFLKDHVGTFDIIFFDASGTLPSNRQMNLKVIGYVFEYNKLTSPGALITNFSFPPKIEPTEFDEKAEGHSHSIKEEMKRIKEFVIEYLKYRLVNTRMNTGSPEENAKFLDQRTDEENYGDYITYQVIDSAYLYIPVLRLLSSTGPLWDLMFKGKRYFLDHLKECKALHQVTASRPASEETVANESFGASTASASNTGDYSSAHLCIPVLRMLSSISSFRSSPLWDQMLKSEERFHKNLKECKTSFDGVTTSRPASEETVTNESFVASTASASNTGDYSSSKEWSILKSIFIDSPLWNLGHVLEDKMQGNIICKTWLNEILPDWNSKSNLNNQKLQFLLLTHLLSYFDDFISEFTNDYFQKKCIEPLVEAFHSDSDQGSSTSGNHKAAFPKFCNEIDFSNTRSLIAGLLYGQMACPSFPVVDKMLRFQYTRERKQMFADVFIFDQCPYVYQQFPSIVRACHATIDRKEQIVFRMVADGLRRHLENVCLKDVFPSCHIASIDPLTLGGTDVQNCRPRIPKRKEVN